LGEIADDEWARGLVARWEQARLHGLVLHADALLAHGEERVLLAGLEASLDEYPLHEPLWARYMTALYRAGRQADALRAYSRLRELLVEELGIDPGREIQELEQLILLQDESLERPSRTPTNLPADGSSFVGRSAEAWPSPAW
jgi:DNA-binding SARP family transcriptional activator